MCARCSRRSNSALVQSHGYHTATALWERLFKKALIPRAAFAIDPYTSRMPVLSRAGVEHSGRLSEGVSDRALKSLTRDDRDRAAAVRALMLGAAGDINFGVSDESRQRAANKRARMARR